MFERFINRVKNIDHNKIIMVAMKDSQKLIVDLNREQLWKGIDSGGNSLSPPYKERTKRVKRKKGQPIDRVTLKDSGKFYDSIIAKPEKTSVLIRSDRMAGGFDLADHLGKRYASPEPIFGLTPENWAKILEDIKPNLIKEIKRAIIKG